MGQPMTQTPQGRHTLLLHTSYTQATFEVRIAQFVTRKDLHQKYHFTIHQKYHFTMQS